LEKQQRIGEDFKSMYVPEVGGWFDAIIGFFPEMNGEKQICAGGDGEPSVCDGESAVMDTYLQNLELEEEEGLVEFSVSRALRLSKWKMLEPFQ